MVTSDLAVFMISTDPQLLQEADETGVIARHRAYAAQVATLDILVIGGTTAGIIQRPVNNCTIYATGGKTIRSLLRARSQARTIVSRRHYNLIVTQDPHLTAWIGMHLQQRLQIPLLIDFHGDFLNNRHWLQESFRHRLYAIMQEKSIRRATGIRVVSFGIQEKLIAAKIPAEKIVVINTPINDGLFTAFDKQQRLLLEKLRFKYADKKMLLFVGRFVPAKNLLFILDVMKDIVVHEPNAVLLLIGEGELKHALENGIKERGLDAHVRIIGHKQPAELVAYYRLASIVLLLSTNESLGKVIIEAGLAGTPALASETTGARNIIDDGATGFLVPINDRLATVDVLREMMEYTDQTASLGATARERYQTRYSYAKTVLAIVNFWLKIAQK